ncbi:SEC-C metal-binding domain-containing protein [Slackia heliotrinireducens]|uniref:SEC-C motif-containing protein n=1 Tax=Slackia heliotrinireducens (strain ATCC 29202 / DSM 20476 / NCTC 11029 / RHS 1) TaxID=471855 RepID=C7N8B3_SLAHD|nr:SEC-C metal-binding domain-containing protein [Slackia heliotrinireducens]ACV23148.1 SEC-C motif-containing protein [Slackia heliotrinireducens DSM 20476]VEH02192.1 SEC-C motif [Slackia heliotrinireducens]
MFFNEHLSNKFFDIFDTLMDYANVAMNMYPDLNDPTGQYIDTQRQSEVADQLWDNIGVMDQFINTNPAGFNREELDIVRSWKSVLSGNLFVVTQPGRPAVFLYEDRVFEVYGITEEVSSITSGATHIAARGALLPFEGKVTYGAALLEMPLELPVEIKAHLNRTIEQAYRENTVIRTAQQFLAAAPGIVEARISREAEAMLADLEFEMNPESQVPGTHRGALAGLEGDARRTALLKNYGTSNDKRIAEAVRTNTFPGPVQTDLFKIVMMATKYDLEDYCRAFGIMGYSKKRKSEIADMVIEEFLHPEHGILYSIVEELSYDTASVVRDICAAGGSFRTSITDSFMNSGKFIMPIPFLSVLFHDRDDIVCVIPDEVRERLNQLDWDAILADKLIRKRLFEVCELCVELRGIATIESVWEEYRRLYPTGYDEAAFRETVMNHAGMEAYLFDVWNTGDTIYLVHFDLDESRSSSSRYMSNPFTGMAPTLAIRALNETPRPLSQYLTELLEVQKDLAPRPIPEAMLSDDPDFSYTNWACAQPGAATFLRFLDEHVPQDADDYTFADSVMSEMIYMSHGGYGMDQVLQFLAGRGFVMPPQHTNRLLEMLGNMFNGLPSWENNGWSPNDLLEQQMGHKVFFNEDGSIMRVGVNDPCPCGSGKRFGDCHGRR